MTTKLRVLLVGWKCKEPPDPSIAFVHVAEDDIPGMNADRFDAVVIGDAALERLAPIKLREACRRPSVPVFLSPDEFECRGLTPWFAAGFKDVVLPEELCDCLRKHRASRSATSPLSRSPTDSRDKKSR